MLNAFESATSNGAQSSADAAMLNDLEFAPRKNEIASGPQML